MARAAAVGTAAVVVLSLLIARACGLDGAPAARAAALFLGSMTLAWTHASRHALLQFGAANQITTARLALTCVVGAMIGAHGTEPERMGWLAVLVILVAAALDGLDGYVARQTGTASAFGARFDMETDSLLVLILSLLVWQGGKAGGWIVLAGLMRYLFIGAASLWHWVGRELFPSVRRKAICVVQVVGLAAVLTPIAQPPASVALAAILLATLAYSFLADLVWLWQRD